MSHGRNSSAAGTGVHQVAVLTDRQQIHDSVRNGEGGMPRVGLFGPRLKKMTHPVDMCKCGVHCRARVRFARHLAVRGRSGGIAQPRNGLPVRRVWSSLHRQGRRTAPRQAHSAALRQGRSAAPRQSRSRGVPGRPQERLHELSQVRRRDFQVSDSRCNAGRLGWRHGSGRREWRSCALVVVCAPRIVRRTVEKPQRPWETALTGTGVHGKGRPAARVAAYRRVVAPSS